MRKLLIPAALAGCLVACLVAPVTTAQAQIYRCQSPDGTPLFQNAPGKNCKVMALPSLTTIPSVKIPAAGRASSAANPATTTTTNTTTASAAPADFPRVDVSAQRSRDSDRKRILQDELNRERSRLDDMLAEYNGGAPAWPESQRGQQKYLDRVERLKDDITRSETNVASLRRELEGVK
jgi:hypothetical protein